jgi:2,3-dihydroxyphenylpropionate 1,2-dioxygenase
MSHFPGTNRYSNPELEWDNRVLDKLRTGNLKSLIGYSEEELDDTGNIELRCWACAAGALGERKPDIVQMNPSWHHNYASLAWFGDAPAAAQPHYPSTKPELVPLINAVHGLAHEAEARTRYLADPGAYAAGFGLSAAHTAALLAMDVPAMVELGVHPLVPFLANSQLQSLRRRQTPSA